MLRFTMLGQGAFKNPPSLILEALSEAILTYDKSKPMVLTLEIFGESVSPEIQSAVKMINAALAKD